MHGTSPPGGASSGAARVRTRAPAGAPCTGTRPAAGAGGVIGLSGPAPRPLRGRLRGGGATVTPRLCPECRDERSGRPQRRPGSPGRQDAWALLVRSPPRLRLATRIPKEGKPGATSFPVLHGCRTVLGPLANPSIPATQTTAIVGGVPPCGAPARVTRP